MVAVNNEYVEIVDLMAARQMAAPAADDTPWPEAEAATGERGFLIAESELGDAHVVNGQIRWEPAASLDTATRDYVAASVAELNRKLADGRLTLDSTGAIRSPHNGQSEEA